MSVTRDLVCEIERVVLRDDVDAASMAVEYRIRGIRLLGSLYPRERRLLRRSKAGVADGGHTQKFATTGTTIELSARLVHDDRKPLETFVGAQLRYSAVEMPRLFSGDASSRRLKSRVRKSFPFTPVLVWLLAWVRAGGPLRGAAARRYALERLIYEAMLRWRVEDAKLTRTPPGSGPGRGGEL
jgi:hypothetical protein